MSSPSALVDVPRRRLTPNLLAISFGTAGVTQCWAVAGQRGIVPEWPADIGWVLVALLWAGTAALYLRNVVQGGRWRTELRDPIFAPFVALIAIVPMQFGVALAEHARAAGVAMFLVGFVLIVLIGGWLSGQWILEELTLAQWHPGYFLPTVAGGFIASIGCSALGFDQLARLMFGWGAICWLVLGSILLLRLFTQPPLPTPLVPAMAIEVAPPVVAGIAWFGINGGQVDGVALGLAGYAILMVLVQVRLIEAYRKVPFALGWWAYSFSYAAAFVLALRWLAAERTPGERAWTIVLLAVVTAAFAALAYRTVVALSRRSFLPKA
jgi:tellurite resistance protein